VILKQYFLACLAQASYLIADESSKTAAVVDPRRDIDEYLEDARKLGLSIRHVILTHFHADFVAGHLELRDRGATVHLGARAKAEYAFHALADQNELVLGPEVKLRALETPGHTPEGISLLVIEADAPKAVLTGDTLFLGDVGRPDLMASAGIGPQELAGQLYDSLRTKLLPLPDAVLVYPAHGAGSLCGKNMSKDTCSTLGVQKLGNWALKDMTREEFVARLTADLPEQPAYFAFDAELNKRERPTLEKTLEKVLRPLSLDETLRLVNAGAQLLDTRDPSAWAAGHVRGSISIGLGGKYAQWAGTLLDRARPIVIVADPGREQESALRLGRIGFDHVAGYIDNGMQALAERRDLLATSERLTANDLAERLKQSNAPVVVDVRAPGEWTDRRIAGAVNVPLSRLRERLAEIPRDRPFVLQCQSGYRSVIAASLLESAGWSGLSDLLGGIVAWEAAKLETTAAS
jgi:glyoxylase-like metal-dependent hydrolase (beta-lactamase superfamily II)/rhodanese-related sulfurtransferase